MGVGGDWAILKNITRNGAQVQNSGSQLGEVLLPGTLAMPGDIFACHSRQGASWRLLGTRATDATKRTLTEQSSTAVNYQIQLFG